MENIIFTQTIPCSECYGKCYPERFNDSQSPCYHCIDILIARQNKTVNPTRTVKRKRVDDAKRSHIKELRSMGYSLGEISNIMKIPRATVQYIVNNAEELKK